MPENRFMKFYKFKLLLQAFLIVLSIPVLLFAQDLIPGLGQNELSGETSNLEQLASFYVAGKISLPEELTGNAVKSSWDDRAGLHFDDWVTSPERIVIEKNSFKNFPDDDSGVLFWGYNGPSRDITKVPSPNKSIYKKKKLAMLFSTSLGIALFPILTATTALG